MAFPVRLADISSSDMQSLFIGTTVEVVKSDSDRRASGLKLSDVETQVES